MPSLLFDCMFLGFGHFVFVGCFFVCFGVCVGGCMCVFKKTLVNPLCCINQLGFLFVVCVCVCVCVGLVWFWCFFFFLIFSVTSEYFFFFRFPVVSCFLLCSLRHIFLVFVCLHVNLDSIVKFGQECNRTVCTGSTARVYAHQDAP